MRRTWLALALAVSLGWGLLASPATAGDPPIKLPSSPKGLKAPVKLPSAVDPAASYQPQTSCSPIDMVGVKKVLALVLKTYGKGSAGSISRGCTEGTSEHSDGRAFDWMVDPADKTQKAAAANFISWVTRNNGLNARRLGIMYVIYNEKIWGVYNAKAGWRPSYDHVDHVHVSFSWNGARGNVSFWTGRISPVDLGPCVPFTAGYAVRIFRPRTTACPAASPVLSRTSLPVRPYGSADSSVKQAQAQLKVKQTGVFDAATWTAVRLYQRAHDIPYTGVLDQATRASLSPSSVTYRAVTGYSRSAAAAFGVAHYSADTLKQGKLAKAVVYLQTALDLPLADRNGLFGTVTLAAVKKAQKRAGLTQDGVVQAAEWRALAAAAR